MKTSQLRLHEPAKELPEFEAIGMEGLRPESLQQRKGIKFMLHQRRQFPKVCVGLGAFEEMQ